MIEAKVTGVSYPTPRPGFTIFTCGFEAPDYRDGWDLVSGSTITTTGYLPHSGEYALFLFGAPAIAKRSVSGFTVGREATVSAWVSMSADDGAGSQIAIVGVVGDDQTTLPVGPVGEYVQVSYTFIPTATTHEIYVGFDDDHSAFGAQIRVDDITVSQSPWTEDLTEFDAAVLGASVTIDETNRPFIEAVLDVGLPTADLLAEIDPRDDVRMDITLDPGGVDRNMDLLIHERRVNPDTGRMELICRSDEALLIDYSRVATTVDSTAVDLLGSLRDIVDYVLDVAIPGASLEAGSDDYAFHVDSENLITNPGAETNATTDVTARNCTIGRTATGIIQGAYIFSLSAPSSNDSSMVIGGDSGAMRLGMVAGNTYTVSGTFRVGAGALSGTTNTYARRIAVFHKKPSDSGYTIESSAAAVNTINTSTKLSVTFTLPTGTSEAFIRFYNGHSSGIAYWDALRLSEGWETSYFDGSTTGTADYGYSWQGSTGVTVSRRVALTNPGSIEMALWEPGVSAWDFLAPLVEASGLRLFCDEQRRWYLDAVGGTSPGSTTLNQAEVLTEVEQTISRAEGGYTGVVLKYQWRDRYGNSRERYAAAGTSERVYVADRFGPYPGPDGAAKVLDRLQGAGISLDMSAISDYTIGPWWSFTADLPLDISLEGFISGLTWSFPDGTMTLTTRNIEET